MRRHAVLALVAVAACAPRGAMLVSSVRVEGYDLVIERCPVSNGDGLSSWDAWRSCTTKRVRFPVVSTSAVGPKLPVSTPDREASYRRIGATRVALEKCADQQGMHGQVAIELILDAKGSVAEVSPPALGDCVRGAVAYAPFPVSLPRTRIAFSVLVPEVAP